MSPGNSWAFHVNFIIGYSCHHSIYGPFHVTDVIENSRHHGFHVHFMSLL